MTAREPLGLRKERDLDEQVVAWYLARPERQGGDVNRALAIGMIIGRLRGCFAPSPALLRVNLAWRERLLAEMLGPDQGEEHRP